MAPTPDHLHQLHHAVEQVQADVVRKPSIRIRDDSSSLECRLQLTSVHAAHGDDRLDHVVRTFEQSPVSLPILSRNPEDFLAEGLESLHFLYFLFVGRLKDAPEASELLQLVNFAHFLRPCRQHRQQTRIRYDSDFDNESFAVVPIVGVDVDGLLILATERDHDPEPLVRFSPFTFSMIGFLFEANGGVLETFETFSNPICVLLEVEHV